MMAASFSFHMSQVQSTHPFFMKKWTKGETQIECQKWWLVASADQSSSKTAASWGLTCQDGQKTQRNCRHCTLPAHSPSRLSRTIPNLMQMCHASTRSTCSAHSMLVVCVHNGLSEFMTSKHHLNMSMSMCIISLHQPELELIQLTNGCCWGAITSCTKPECSCWCGWWEMAGVFLTFFAHAAKTGFQHLCKLSAQKHFMFQAIKLFSFPLRISASLKSIGFSTKPLPRTKNCSFNKNHSQRMPDSCGLSMVAEVPLFLSNVNSKYRIVPSFAVACAEPSWSKVGTSIWLKTWSFATAPTQSCPRKVATCCTVIGVSRVSGSKTYHTSDDCITCLMLLVRVWHPRWCETRCVSPIDYPK